MVYTVDVDRCATRPPCWSGSPATARCGLRPDTDYRLVAQAPEGLHGPRPVVIGAGPCGLFAGLILAQMGFKPIILDRGKVVRERTKDTWACGARAS
jgi:uncharacterized FAD-dependent dehydrogenase